MRLVEQAKKVGAKALLAVEEHGFENLSEWRMNICQSCPNFRAESLQCGVCGCYMDIKTTLATNRNPHALGRIEVTHCPQGRWNDAHIVNLYRALDGEPLIEEYLIT